MIYYPVYIPTLNRYTHFKRCVESLARNTYADKTELVIGLDYPPEEKYVEGYLKIKEYIVTINGFKKVTVFERKENYGPLKNSIALLEYVFTHYDAAIFTEDDNEFSPCFLDYMNKALDEYKDNEKVVSISGFIGKGYYGGIQKKLLLNHDSCAWGMGMWRAKRQTYTVKDFQDVILSYTQSFKVFITSPGILSMLIDMVQRGVLWGDVAKSTINIINGTYQLHPSFSLVRNRGLDGTGVHCSSTDPDDLAHQMISDEKLFKYDMYDIEDASNLFVRKQMFVHVLPKGVVMKLRFFKHLILKYLQLRSELKNVVTIKE